jgi:hypothetical protein
MRGRCQQSHLWDTPAGFRNGLLFDADRKFSLCGQNDAIDPERTSMPAKSTRRNEHVSPPPRSQVLYQVLGVGR